MRCFTRFNLASLFLGGLFLLCVSQISCKNEPVDPAKESGQVTRTEKKADIPIEKCGFDKFDPKEQSLSVYAKKLMYKLGTGILKQPGGSLVKIHCPDGSTHVAWINSDGALVSVVYGLKFDDINFLASYPGKSAHLRLLERKDDEWVEVSVPFKDVRTALPSGSKEAAYSVFPNAPVSEYSARLLKYLGIGMEGSESTVRLRIGDDSGTGLVDSSGKLKITNDRSWDEPIE